MTKPTSWEVKKTHIINVDGNPVEVSKLPEKIKFEIETLDLFKTDYVKVLYQREVLEHALNGKMREVIGLIRDHFTPKTEQPASQEVAKIDETNDKGEENDTK